MIAVNGRRQIKPDKGILDFFKKILMLKVHCIVNGGFYYIAGLIDNDEKLRSVFYKTLNIANSSRLECKNHTRYETKMTKIDTLFLAKMSLKIHTL